MRATELASSQAVLPSLAEAGIHTVASHESRKPTASIRAHTVNERRQLYRLARLAVKRSYPKPLTLEAVAKALAPSPRQLQRAYSQFGDITFREDLRTTRMAAARELLAKPAIPVCDIAPLVGYRNTPHFARTFRSTYGLAPSAFRAELGQEPPGTSSARPETTLPSRLQPR